MFCLFVCLFVLQVILSTTLLSASASPFLKFCQTVAALFTEHAPSILAMKEEQKYELGTHEFKSLNQRISALQQQNPGSCASTSLANQAQKNMP